MEYGGFVEQDSPIGEGFLPKKLDSTFFDGFEHLQHGRSGSGQPSYPDKQSIDQRHAVTRFELDLEFVERD